MIIDYCAQDFPPGSPTHLTGWHSMTPTWDDLVWAAVSVGKNGLLDMFAHGQFSVHEIRFRSYMVYANLQETDSYLSRSSAYDDLDPSEKGAVSFFFGMAFAKLMAELLFDAPWAIHLRKFQRSHHVSLAGRSRPDLVGQTPSGDWVIIEAKGRTNVYSPRVMQSAKRQALEVRAIGRTRPKLRVASQVYFSRSLEMRVRDPDGDDGEYELDITPAQFLATYYEPFVRIPTEQTRQQLVEGQSYSFVDFADIGVSIGVRRDIITSSGVRINRPDRFEFERRTLPTAGHWGGALSLYRDGLAVELDARWTQDSMQRGPEDR